MSLSHCGKDSQGRDIGYAYAAKCDHPVCDKDIDRGLSYACGGMHGSTELGCEKYFCEGHMLNTAINNGDYVELCDYCAADLIRSDEWILDTIEDCIVRK